MVGTGSSNSKKSLEFEINLIPCIDLLAVCICYLLLTAVWVQIGTLNIKQAIGGQSDNGPATPSLWASVEKNGAVVLEVKNAPRGAGKKVSLAGVEGKPDLSGLRNQVEAYKKAIPDLVTGIVVPQAATVYGDLVTVMDELKGVGVSDVGVTAL